MAMEDYVLLQDLYDDDYYPDSLVEELERELTGLVDFLEAGEADSTLIQRKLDGMTSRINEIAEEFIENDSRIESMAAETLEADVSQILNEFGVDIEMEEALREREGW